MKLLIVSPEHISKNERYMDDKGWFFKEAFGMLNVDTELFWYKKKGKLSFIEKDKILKKYWHAYMNKNLLTYVMESKPDVLFIVKGETIYPETLWDIRKKTDIIILNVFTDNPLLMGNFDAIVPCHYFFVKDSYIVNTLKKSGLKNIFYLPQCTNADVHRPVNLDEKERKKYSSDITLIGTMYPYRRTFLKNIRNFDLAIWGRGWDKVSHGEMKDQYHGGNIRGTEKAKAICGAKISLNLHHPLNDIQGTNSRTFDISACRGFQLADYKSDMDTLFEVGEEIICFNSVDEFRKLAAYYLKHPDERHEVAENAYQRVLKEHTYINRANQILEIIHLVKRG